MGMVPCHVLRPSRDTDEGAISRLPVPTGVTLTLGVIGNIHVDPIHSSVVEIQAQVRSLRWPTPRQTNEHRDLLSGWCFEITNMSSSTTTTAMNITFGRRGLSHLLHGYQTGDKPGNTFEAAELRSYVSKAVCGPGPRLQHNRWTSSSANCHVYREFRGIRRLCKSFQMSIRECAVGACIYIASSFAIHCVNVLAVILSVPGG
ncbi:hypothetical protein Dda_8266 [Drechslerella dactyloides]|uniref:Uncharacterized protein n=1 Tax=Drechslerella dactyloides TaxID=74499 RepID=A0AAD6NGJ2_DREDA|nr:hypothetical protein Dda_8266 [Drechslerella dactyloides]